MNDDVKKFLGTGWSFPISIDRETGRIKTESYEESVAQSIKIIIMTQTGERVMRPGFGSGLRSFTFETADYSNLAVMEKEIRTALVKWEPRITDVEVSVKQDDNEAGRVNIFVGYVVRSTNNPYNIVYPYYLNEGM